MCRISLSSVKLSFSDEEERFMDFVKALPWLRSILLESDGDNQSFSPRRGSGRLYDIFNHTVFTLSRV